MPKILYFSDSVRRGQGATFLLDGGEYCMVSVAQSSVKVKKSRSGIFGATLYKETLAYQVGLTARALNFLYQDNLLPPGFESPVLSAFANAIMHCTTCAQVTIVLNEAIKKAAPFYLEKNQD